MILIITLNPLLEKRYHFKTVSYGTSNRNGKLQLQAGGKGINVSRQLKSLGIDSFNFIFSGGSNGKLYRELLKQEGLSFTHIQTSTETREAAVVIGEKDYSVTSYFSENALVSNKESEEFKLKLEKIIQNCEMIVFSGSSPSTATDEIIPLGIELANKYDKISICDTYGSFLENCINSQPTMLHNNIEELQSSLNLESDDEEAIVKQIDKLFEKKIKRTFITNSEKEFYARNFDFIYKIKPPKIETIDSTGSGDSFIAGIIYCWKNDFNFETSLRFATSLAAANAKNFTTSMATFEQVEELKDLVIITPVGKRMKLVDDRPTKI